MKAIIKEQGNGFPTAGDYVAGSDGNLYQIESIDSRIMTGETGSGAPNWIRATVELVEWDECDEDDEFPALAVVDDDDEDDDDD